MWNSALSRLVGVKYPILQAPMAGGPSTPQLVAAVSNAGGLGCLGCGYASPDAIRAEISATRKLTDKPFAVNLFTPPTEGHMAPSQEEISTANKLLDPYRQELGLPVDVALPTKYAEKLEDQLQVILEEKPPVFSFTFGLPPDGFLNECRRRKIWTIGTATRVAEAQAMANQVDFVVAQGIEAGGHRGNIASIPDDPFLGLMPLIPQLVKENVQVIAAGGLMDGRQIHACLAMGACGVSLGTAFLLCPEAGTSAPYRAALRNEASSVKARGTEFTRVISGRLARGIRNRFMDEMKQFDDKIPTYPFQNALTSVLRKECAKAGKWDFLSLWAGQGVDRIREMPAKELLETLVAEAEHAAVWA